MPTLLLSFTFAYSHRLTELAFAVGALGALVLAATSATPGWRTQGRALAGVLLAMGLVLMLVVVHFGVDPFFLRKTRPH